MGGAAPRAPRLARREAGVATGSRGARACWLRAPARAREGPRGELGGCGARSAPRCAPARAGAGPNDGPWTMRCALRASTSARARAGGSQRRAWVPWRPLRQRPTPVAAPCHRPGPAGARACYQPGETPKDQSPRPRSCVHASPGLRAGKGELRPATHVKSGVETRPRATRRPPPPLPPPWRQEHRPSPAAPALPRPGPSRADGTSSARLLEGEATPPPPPTSLQPNAASPSPARTSRVQEPRNLGEEGLPSADRNNKATLL